MRFYLNTTIGCREVEFSLTSVKDYEFELALTTKEVDLTISQLIEAIVDIFDTRSFKIEVLVIRSESFFMSSEQIALQRIMDLDDAAIIKVYKTDDNKPEDYIDYFLDNVILKIPTTF